ncbi:hypothetical protein L226DRAFT_531096 [Lentinus tigrinus ALCF2SS1-7]|uniref:Uncharacterized protein n=1 Tax=Lentinus tigrinus ALCF2SS1-6 TaxID=1328759 RepID=A0A5C2SVR0_9APHY|nr:hypothetical protein L227DRAFT_560128 [Lentinus tigrinus ALCF2SS1-6]RPD79273.1 hypothetical protein L226DRAFT_531096 [Lentinus tigrinus ALCF2SS1-7]
MDAHPQMPNATTAPFRPADLPPMVTVVDTQGETLRDIYMEDIIKRFPNFKPRDDVDIWLLGPGNLYNGPEEGIRAWIDNKLAMHVSHMGSEETVRRVASEFLSPVTEVTGRKPNPGMEGPPIFVCAIPNSEYSMRLFPGAFKTREYCLDFVKSDTGEPENSPFEFELWALLGPSLYPYSMRLLSLEQSSGIRPEDIVPGAETFVLRDGMVCLLKRPGHRTVRFKVPVRVKETASAGEARG